MKVFDVEKYKDELSSKSASFVKKELMVMEKKRNQAAGKMLDLENQYATISSDYAFVNRYLELKENLEKITDEQAKNAFKQEKDFLKLERDFNKISARLQSDADFKQAFEKYGEFYIQRQDAISKIRVLEGEILTKNFSSPSLIKKLLPLTASLLAAASLGVGALVFLNEKATKSEVKEPVKTVQNGAKKTNASDKKNSVTYTPEQPKKSDLMVFEDKIKSYSPDTQKAMQKAIIWLQKSNAFLKAVAKNDLSARTTAKIEMDVLKAAMQNLDNNVWLAVNDDVNRIYAAIDVQKPGADFDLSYAYRKLPEMYEKRVKVQKNPNIQLFQKMGITPVLNEEAITVGDFDTAVDLAVKAFKDIDIYFDLYANNPQDERLPVLQKNIDKTAIQISNKQPGMFLFFVNEVETTLKHYQKTGQKPAFNKSLCWDRFKRHASFIQNNPEKIVQAYNAFFKLNEDNLKQRPPLSRDGR